MKDSAAEVAALEKCIKIWQWLAKNVGAAKSEAYVALMLSADEHECPLCEYVTSIGKHCYACPLLARWGGNKPSDSVCMDKGSYYIEWKRYTIKHFNSLFLKKYYGKKVKINANKIVSICKKRLNELRKFKHGVSEK